MGYADDHVYVLVGLDVGYRRPDGLDGVGKFQLAGRRTGQGVLAENAHHGNVRAAFFNDCIVSDIVQRKGVPNQLLAVGQAVGFHRFPVYVADDHGGYIVAGFLGTGQHVGQTLGTIVELVVAEGRRVAADQTQQPQLGGLCLKHGLDQCAHREVAAVEDQRVGILRLLGLDQRVHAGKAADVDLPIVEDRGKRVDVRVGVVGKKYVDRLVGFGCCAYSQRAESG